VVLATTVSVRTPPDVLGRVASLVDDEDLDVRRAAFDLLDLEGARAAELEQVLARWCAIEAHDTLRR
jgi:hypothetical protein